MEIDGGSYELTDDFLVPEVGFGPFVAMAVTRPLLVVAFGLAVVAATVLFGDRSGAIARSSASFPRFDFDTPLLYYLVLMVLYLATCKLSFPGEVVEMMCGLCLIHPSGDVAISPAYTDRNLRYDAGLPK